MYLFQKARGRGIKNKQTNKQKTGSFSFKETSMKSHIAQSFSSHWPELNHEPEVAERKIHSFYFCGHCPDENAGSVRKEKVENGC